MSRGRKYFKWVRIACAKAGSVGRQIWWVKETNPVWLEAGEVWCVCPYMRACLHTLARMVSVLGSPAKRRGPKGCGEVLGA